MNRSENNERPSVRSLASKTGLSVATISRVLNNSGDVSDSTRLRVKQAMKESGYVPNSAARALSTRRTRTIGAVLPTLSASIFSRFIDAMEDRLAHHGYALVVATTRNDPKKEGVRARELLDMGAEGLVLSGAGQIDSLLTLLSNADVPTICSSIHRTGNGLVAIGYDNAHVADQAIEYLHSLGHTRIAVIHGPVKNNDRTQLRLEGIQTSSKLLGVSVDYFDTTMDIEGGSIIAKKVLQKPLQFSAVLCLSDVIALGFLFEANRRKIAIPKALSLMGFDDLEWASLSHPTLTTIRLPTGRMGSHIADALVGKLEHGNKLKSLTLTATIVERESTAKLKG